MIEIALTAIIGILAGTAGTLFVLNHDKETLPDKTSETQQEIIHQLTDLDLIKEICKPENTKTKEGFLLCREMTCFVYSRGIDSETSGKQCEEISNISNTISMIEYCKEHTDAGSICYEIFYRRK
jgi:hypothetical protein